MRHAPVRAPGEQREALAPARGFDADEPVVVPLHQLDDRLRRGEVDVGERILHDAREALVIDPGHVGVFPVEARGVLGGKVAADRVEIRPCVPDEPDPVVHREGRGVEEAVRRLQEPVDSL